MESVPYFKREIDFSDSSQMLECIKYFDKKNTQSLDARDFDVLSRTLLTDDQGKPNNLSVRLSADLFTTFDKNNDRKIDAEEFVSVWNHWIVPLLKPVSALIVIDVQNDFIDGTLALKNCTAKQDGYEVIPIINDITETVKFDVIAYSLDSHPEDHISFFDNVNNYQLNEDYENTDINLYDTVIFEGPPKIEQKLWPSHCIKETWGSELHKDLKVDENAVTVFKGTKSNIDSYSAFWDNMKLSQTALNVELRKRDVTHVFICGLAFDYCVGSTAVDAIEFGYATTIIEDATRETDPNVAHQMKKKLLSMNCVFAKSHEVESLKNGKNVKTEFASIIESALRKKYENDIND